MGLALEFLVKITGIMVMRKVEEGEGKSTGCDRWRKQCWGLRLMEGVLEYGRSGVISVDGWMMMEALLSYDGWSEGMMTGCGLLAPSHLLIFNKCYFPFNQPYYDCA